MQVEPDLLYVFDRPDFLRPGTQFESQVLMDADGAPTITKLEVSKLKEIVGNNRSGYRVTWMFRGAPYWLLHAERVRDFIHSEGGSRTEHYCWEAMAGLLAYGVKLFFGP
ncbi:hypothetical protein G7054_g1363 [Neopestalotiopsis clavispora]|nr:hypothetical protein G7054_g1363 [Neopestalotiopsis clavispora]